MPSFDMLFKQPKDCLTLKMTIFFLLRVEEMTSFRNEQFLQEIEGNQSYIRENLLLQT